MGHDTNPPSLHTLYLEKDTKHTATQNPAGTGAFEKPMRSFGSLLARYFRVRVEDLSIAFNASGAAATYPPRHERFIIRMNTVDLQQKLF